MGDSCVKIIQNVLVNPECTLLVHGTLGGVHGPHDLGGQEALQLATISGPPALGAGPGVTGGPPHPHVTPRPGADHILHPV